MSKDQEQFKKLSELDKHIDELEHTLKWLYKERRELVNYLNLNKDTKRAEIL